MHIEKQLYQQFSDEYKKLLYYFKNLKILD